MPVVHSLLCEVVLSCTQHCRKLDEIVKFSVDTEHIWAHFSSAFCELKRIFMWLPTPVYERIPQFYFLLGMLFITNGLYIGFENSVSFAYILFGMLSSSYGVGIFLVRRAFRSKPADNAPSPESIPSDSAQLAE